MSALRVGVSGSVTDRLKQTWTPKAVSSVAALQTQIQPTCAQFPSHEVMRGRCGRLEQCFDVAVERIGIDVFNDFRICLCSVDSP